MSEAIERKLVSVELGIEREVVCLGPEARKLLRVVLERELKPLLEAGHDCRDSLFQVYGDCEEVTDYDAALSSKGGSHE